MLQKKKKKEKKKKKRPTSSGEDSRRGVLLICPRHRRHPIWIPLTSVDGSEDIAVLCTFAYAPRCTLGMRSFHKNDSRGAKERMHI